MAIDKTNLPQTLEDLFTFSVALGVMTDDSVKKTHQFNVAMVRGQTDMQASVDRLIALYSPQVIIDSTSEARNTVREFKDDMKGSVGAFNSAANLLLKKLRRDSLLSLLAISVTIILVVALSTRMVPSLQDIAERRATILNLNVEQQTLDARLSATRAELSDETAKLTLFGGVKYVRVDNTLFNDCAMRKPQEPCATYARLR